LSWNQRNEDYAGGTVLFIYIVGKRGYDNGGKQVTDVREGGEL
jgi:hypothetical protein